MVMDQNIQKKMATEIRAMVQNRECANTARMPAGESTVAITISVLRVRFTLQPARCKRSVRYPPEKFETAAKRNGNHATTAMPARFRPRSRVRNSGIQKT